MEFCGQETDLFIYFGTLDSDWSAAASCDFKFPNICGYRGNKVYQTTLQVTETGIGWPIAFCIVI